MVTGQGGEEVAQGSHITSHGSAEGRWRAESLVLGRRRLISARVSADLHGARLCLTYSGKEGKNKNNKPVKSKSIDTPVR